jgi:hypothetical protein
VPARPKWPRAYVWSACAQILCNEFSRAEVSGWVGQIETLTTNNDGRRVMSVAIGNKIYLAKGSALDIPCPERDEWAEDDHGSPKSEANARSPHHRERLRGDPARQMKHDPRERSSGCGCMVRQSLRRARTLICAAVGHQGRRAVTLTSRLPTRGGAAALARRAFDGNVQVLQRETHHGLHDCFAVSVCHVRNCCSCGDGFLAQHQGEAVGSATGNAGCSVRGSCDRLNCSLAIVAPCGDRSGKREQ